MAIAAAVVTRTDEAGAPEASRIAQKMKHPGAALVDDSRG